MKIAIIDGNPDPENTGFDEYVGGVVRRWRAGGHDVAHFCLRELEIQPCTGCWSCWWKTPGLCRVADDSDEIRRQFVAAELMLVASPLLVGFPSALCKSVIDKWIPIAHPYIELREGECCHLRRYDRVPTLATLIQPASEDTGADVAIVHRYFERFAWHGHTRVAFQRTTDCDIEEFCHELDRL